MTDNIDKFNIFLNRLSYRNLAAGSPDSESGIEVEDKIRNSRDRITNLRNEKINNSNSYLDQYNNLFNNETARSHYFSDGGRRRQLATSL
jgi:hypothetical protein